MVVYRCTTSPFRTTRPSAGSTRSGHDQRAAWKQLLNKITIDIPEKRLIDVMKSNFGYVLINRDTPWFKPGSRNYNHAWMRDGALTGMAMLRMGQPELVEAVHRGVHRLRRDNGWVPYMIHRGRQAGAVTTRT